MKAAVINKPGETPQYQTVANPVVRENEEIIMVKAASIKNLDKSRAANSHYDKHVVFPAIMGVDGVGVLADGTRVYASSKHGMMAEQAVLGKGFVVNVPDNLDDVTAAAIPNPAISAWVSIEWKGQLKPGGAVLILGATGITGKLAIQIAKYLGAGRIVAAGRNPEALKMLPGLGADAVISLNQSDEEIRMAVKAEAAIQPFDIVLDYLWGRPAEIVLSALAGNDLNAVPHLTRYIQIGAMAGQTINLPSEVLRSTMIEITGVGGGSIPTEVIATIPTEILPKIFQLAAEGVLTIETEALPLKDVEQVWNKKSDKRMVLVP